ncbi:MAG TPA: hypothetical protein PKD72_13900 [Gemmatales bacterium]|nr:hypothetical protein [Gemmatales bacterium]
MQSSSPQTLALVLRLSAILFLIAWFGAIMPSTWMEYFHRLSNTGSWSDTPFFEYLARCTSALFGFYGVMTWYLSKDVERYLPLIRFLAWSGLPMAVILTYIGYVAGLPAWWYGTEGFAVILISLIWIKASQ